MMMIYRSETLKHPNAGKTDSLPRQRSKAYYQTMEWRRFRNNKKALDRKVDMKFIDDIYQDADNATGADLYEFVYNSDMPMCEECKRNGKIKPSYYLDHIDRIRAGGSHTDEDNLQWLCSSCDARKRSEESR